MGLPPHRLRPQRSFLHVHIHVLSTLISQSPPRTPPHAGLIVSAYDSPLKARKHIAQVARLRLDITPLRSRRETDGHSVRVQVSHEPRRAWQERHRRPARILQRAPLREVVLDCVLCWDCRGECIEQVRCCCAFGCSNY